MDRGDVEQRTLTAALFRRKAATMLEFYSPRGCLCSSLQGFVHELDDGADGCATAMGDFTRKKKMMRRDRLYAELTSCCEPVNCSCDCRRIHLPTPAAAGDQGLADGNYGLVDGAVLIYPIDMHMKKHHPVTEVQVVYSY